MDKYDVYGVLSAPIVFRLSTNDDPVYAANEKFNECSIRKIEVVIHTTDGKEHECDIEEFSLQWTGSYKEDE